jgi:diacylglycerol kinase (ATP)
LKEPNRSRLEGKLETPRVSPESILVIFNPAARSEKAGRWREKIQALDARAVVRLTGGPGDAAAMAAMAVQEGYKTVVAAGGDGTINEVVNGLADSDVTLGLLPLGTMNVYAAELRIPSNRLRQCWDIIRAGHVRRVDLARANAHCFVQLAGVGFDAQAVAGVDWQAKKNFGPLSYLISAAKVATLKPPRLRIESEDSPAQEGSFVLVGNGRYYGGRVAVFKQAVIDDGKLDVLVFKNLGYLDIIRYLQGILMGTHLSLPDVEYFQTRRLTVTSASGEDVPFEADGELMGYVPVTFRVARQRLKVLAPPR